MEKRKRAGRGAEIRQAKLWREKQSSGRTDMHDHYSEKTSSAISIDIRAIRFRQAHGSGIMGFALSFCLRDSTIASVSRVHNDCERKTCARLAPSAAAFAAFSRETIRFQSLHASVRLRVLFLRQRNPAFSENFTCLCHRTYDLFMIPHSCGKCNRESKIYARKIHKDANSDTIRTQIQPRLSKNHGCTLKIRSG